MNKNDSFLPSMTLVLFIPHSEFSSVRYALFPRSSLILYHL